MRPELESTTAAILEAADRAEQLHASTLAERQQRAGERSRRLDVVRGVIAMVDDAAS